MNYKIKILKKAQKFINKQTKVQQLRILKAIYNLPDGDIKKLTGTNEYRIRVGEYRVIYVINNDVLLITVTHAGNRGQIYNKL